MKEIEFWINGMYYKEKDENVTIFQKCFEKKIDIVNDLNKEYFFSKINENNLNIFNKLFNVTNKFIKFLIKKLKDIETLKLFESNLIKFIEVKKVVIDVKAEKKKPIRLMN